MPAILVVGYGNALRTDDGIGWHVADRLADDPRMDGITVLRLHQLAPELALDFSRADRVILVDASHDLPAGTFSIAPVAGADDGSTTWSHHLSAASLVALAAELYGHAPQVFQLGVGVESVEVGDVLSPTLDAALPLIVDAVAVFVAAFVAESAFVPGVTFAVVSGRA